MKKLFFVTLLALLSATVDVNAQQPADGQASSERIIVKDRRRLDVEPSFRGGDIKTFGQWLEGRTKRPAAFKRKSLEGPVKVSFIIDEQGKLTDVTVLEAITEDMGVNFTKALLKSPQWSPGILAGKPVATQYIYTMYFFLGE